jgi:hypothetical protein
MVDETFSFSGVKAPFIQQRRALKAGFIRRCWKEGDVSPDDRDFPILSTYTIG